MPVGEEITFAPPFMHGIVEVELPTDDKDPEGSKKKFKKLVAMDRQSRKQVNILFPEEMWAEYGNSFLGLDQKLEIADSIPDNAPPPPGE